MMLKQFVETRRFHREPNENVTGSDTQCWFGYCENQQYYILLNDDGTFSLVIGSGETVSRNLAELEAQLYCYCNEEGAFESLEEVKRKSALRRMNARIEELKRDLERDGIDTAQLLSVLQAKLGTR